MSADEEVTAPIVSELHFPSRPSVPMDLTGESEVISPAKAAVDVGGKIVGFLFSVYDEDGRLFLFMKLDGCNRTICIEYEKGEFCLQFLPVEDRKDELVEEAMNVVENCGGKLNEFAFERRKYAFDDDSIPFEADWMVAHVSGTCDMTKIPRKGSNFRCVFGTTSALWEVFCAKYGIRGPVWVEVTGLEPSTLKCLSIPCFRLTDSFKLDVLHDHDKVPCFNVCSFAMQKVNDEVVMISAKMTSDCHLMRWSDVSETITWTTTRSDVVPEGVVKCKSLREMIESFVEALERYDIDVIVSFDLRSDFQFLYTKMCQEDIVGWWRMGRIRRGFVSPSLEDNMYSFLGGRIRCDLRDLYLEFCRPKSTSFCSIVKNELGIERQSLESVDIAAEIEDQSRLYNLIQYNRRDAHIVERLCIKVQLFPLTITLAQLSGCSWSRSMYGRVSYRCEALFVSTFQNAGYVVPEKGTNCRCSLERREVQYEGGLVLEPNRGFYDDCVLLLDFNSLYPSIIREYNLCFSTLLDLEPTASDEDMVAYATAIKDGPRGILPAVMEELMEARAKIKEDIASSHDEATRKALEIKQQGVKILSNAMYGYLGSPVSRFLSVHIARMITCLGRHILQQTTRALEQQNHTVIYGDTDSVFVTTSTKDPELAKELGKQLCISLCVNYRVLKLGLETVIVKLLLTNKKKYAYIDSSGKTTVKGLDLVRREWCGLSKYICSFVLDKFFHLDRPTAVAVSLKEMRRIATMLVRTNGQPQNPVLEGQKPEITVSDLIITKSITKPLADYTRNAVNVAVGRWMVDNGYKVVAGDTIPFVMMNNKAKSFDDKAWHPSRVACVADVDFQYYIGTQLIPPLIRLCEPFGDISPEEIKAAFGISPGVKAVHPATECNLYYSCPNCASRVILGPTMSMRCRKCNVNWNWRAVANELTRCLREMLQNWTSKNEIVCKSCRYRTQQLFVSSHSHVTKSSAKCEGHLEFEVRNLDVYHHLKNLLEKAEAMKRGNMESEIGNYLCNTINALLDMHGMNKLRISTILRVPQMQDS